jgi:hypothetical protein
METIQLEYLNLIAEYMLHALVESQRAWESFCMLSRMSETWKSSWRKTLMHLTGLSRSSPARPWRRLFHFPSVAYASMRITIS